MRPVLAFAAGFLLAQLAAFWLFREVFESIGEHQLTLRYVTISASEVALAVFAFAMGWRGVRNSSASALSCALVAGFLIATFTVGANPVVPRLMEGNPQLLLQALTGAILSGVLGFAAHRMFPSSQ